MEKWIFFALLSMFFAGITSVLAKFGMKNISSDTALLIRTTFVFGYVAVNAFLFKDVIREIKISPITNFYFLAFSAFTTALSWIFYYRAMKTGPVAYVTSIDKASILVTIVLSYFLLKEPITPKLIIGSVLILFGLLILIWK